MLAPRMQNASLPGSRAPRGAAAPILFASPALPLGGGGASAEAAALLEAAGTRAMAAPRRSLALMYHEVVAEGRDSVAGGSGAVYKLHERDFREHLAAIRQAIGDKPVGRADDPATWGAGTPFFLTFDDGEDSACAPVAGLLETYGWRGHFFITTDFIGTPGFLSPNQIRELHAAGHLIGSHSCSHPPRMSRLGWRQLEREWSESAKILADIIGRPVRVASVPGGFYSRQVAQAAASAGIRILFTSEPTTRTEIIDGCLVLGRYFVQRHTSPGTAAAIASGRRWPRWKQALLWKLKKVAKIAGGGLYLSFREMILTSKKQP